MDLHSTPQPTGRRIFATIFWAALCALAAGCSAFGPPPVVGAGSSTPASERPDDLFARLDDRTVVPAYEFGVCESDADCAPRGCGGAMCSPNDEPAICHAGLLAECFASVPASECGCVEGACRWARTAPVIQCAVLGAQPPTNRPVRGTEPAEMYPIRND